MKEHSIRNLHEHQRDPDANKLKHNRTSTPTDAKESKVWDPTGVWHIFDITIEEEDVEDPDDTRSKPRLQMVIYYDDFDIDDIEDPDTPSDDRLHSDPCLSASFNFGTVKGLMRIFPPCGPWTAPKDNDSEQIVKFEYAWRGRETVGECVVDEEDADEGAREIMFFGSGTQLEGMFYSELTGTIAFSAVKVSPGNAAKKSLDWLWDSLAMVDSEEEDEDARDRVWYS